MRFNYFNKEKIHDLYIHDCEFEGYQYDYDKKQVSFYCKNEWEGDPKEVHCIFNEVIYCNMQSARYWGEGNCTLGIYFEDNSDVIEPFIQLQKKIWKERFDMGIYLYEIPLYLEGEYVSYKNKVYVPVTVEFNSGDTFLVICENFDWFEKRLEI